MAATTILTVGGSSGTVLPSDLYSVLDIVAVVAPALLLNSTDTSGTGRRLLQTSTDASATAEALAALSRSFSIVAGIQAALLAPMVSGESASAGTGSLVAAAGVTDLQTLPNSSAVYAIGATGATVTLLPGFASLVAAARPSTAGELEFGRHRHV